MELNENIMNLLVRHLNGESSPEEDAELTAWLDEDPAHREEMNAYRRLWQESAEVVNSHQFDTTRAWQEVEKKILDVNDEPAKRAPIASLKRIAVAAAILGFITVAAIYFFGTEKRQWITVVAGNQNRVINLPDQSVVTLRAGSTLKYAEDYGREARDVRLQGEAFFDVQRNEDQAFTVSTPRALVTVLGTSFQIAQSDTADQLVVTTGRVAFSDKKDTAVRVVLSAGQRATLRDHRIAQDTIAGQNFAAWRTGKLVFRNTPILQALADISHTYQVPVKLAPGGDRDSITIRAEFKNEPLEEVLEELELITGLTISREKGVIWLGK